MAQTSVMHSADYAGDGLRVGRVLNRALETLFRHFFLFFTLSAIPSLTYLLLALGGLGAGPAGPNGPRLGAVGGLFILTMLVTPVIQAIVLYGTFQDMRGRAFGFGESLMKGLARFFPIIGLAICQVFMYALGGVLLVIPAFIFMAMYFVALPACVIEKAGPIASMKRSAVLTKGHRWKVFGLFLLLALISAVGGGVIGAVFKVVGSPMVSTIVTFVWQALIGAFQAIAVAVAYHDLRVAKEGIDVEKMAAVFD